MKLAKLVEHLLTLDQNDCVEVSVRKDEKWHSSTEFVTLSVDHHINSFGGTLYIGDDTE
jgi:hypothetical protein